MIVVFFVLWLIFNGRLTVEIILLGLLWTQGKGPDPVMVEFHSGLEGDFANVILANSITLTPGTFTVSQKGDHFVIHCLREEFSKGLDDSSFIHLLRRIRA